MISSVAEEWNKVKVQLFILNISYPAASGIATCGGLSFACDRQEKAPPHGASNLFHLLPQKPHRRIWLQRPQKLIMKQINPFSLWIAIWASQSLECEELTFEAFADAVDAFLVRHAATGTSGRHALLGTVHYAYSPPSDNFRLFKETLRCKSLAEPGQEKKTHI